MLYLRSALNGEVDYTIIFRKKKQHRNKKHTKKNPQQTSCGIFAIFLILLTLKLLLQFCFQILLPPPLVSQFYGWQTSLALKLFTPPTDGSWHWFRSTQNGWMGVDATTSGKLHQTINTVCIPYQKWKGKDIFSFVLRMFLEDSVSHWKNCSIFHNKVPGHRWSLFIPGNRLMNSCLS